GCATQQSTETAEPKDVYPSKPINVIVGYGPGGGTDTFARTVTKILNDEKIVEQPFVITNKPGAVGAIAMTYVSARKGDPYTLLFLPSLGTPLITGETGASYSDFIRLARLAAESNIITVSSKSQFSSFEDFVKEVKANPGKIRVAGTAAQGAEAFQWYSLAKLIGSEFNYIPFNSGSEAAAALMGGQVDACLTNPSEGIDQVKAGEWRALAVLSDTRMGGLPDVPTVKELGYDFSFYMDRSVWGPADLPEEVIAFWDNAFSQLVQTSAWKEYLENNVLQGEYLNHEEYEAYLPVAVERYTQFIKEVGAL
ncbi:MAG: tripartite tricarboxylate transporter substrate binding protein, partial [Syntrophomonadaceae bacterium]|nr:tripartite tricarboxylate transporter substrate binding protein [Syntrophomonadaceae bacterium]